MTLEAEARKRMVACLTETPIESAYLFGSYATGKAEADSDVDILVELPPEVNLLQLAKIKRSLEKATGKRVDLLTEEGIAPEIRPFVNRQKILIYERQR